MKYENGKIYKLINDEMPDCIYYGSTCIKYLSSRLSKHKYNAKKNKDNFTSKKLFEYGKVKIILVENFPCNDINELKKRERYYIENNNCVNKAIPSRTKKEYNIYYREKYKKDISEKKKEYYIKNQERLKQKQKEYYMKRKKLINNI